MKLAALLAAGLLLPGLASAQKEDPRDSLFFGTPAADEDEGDEEGGASASKDERDELFFGGGGEDDSRDDEIFGGDHDTIFLSAPKDSPMTTEEERDEGRLLSSGEIERRMALQENKLDIGGLLYLRMGYGQDSEGLPEASPIDSPNLLDLYLDARPTDRLRAFVRGRLTHSFNATETTGALGRSTAGGTSAALDQLWLKFDVEHTLYVTAGRQPIRWGAGRFWNPTDFLNAQRRDPLAVLDERLGVSLLKLHLPLEASGWNLYALANVEDASRVDEIGGALRVEKLVGSTEFSLSAAARKDTPLRLGADISFPLGPVDLRAEAAVLHGERKRFYRGDASLQPLRIPQSYSREDDWIPQAVVGIEIPIAYSEEDSLSIGAEYFYNGAGYSDTDLYPVLILSGDFIPLYLGRHYGALYAAAVGPGSWNDTTLIASVLGNLDDGSFLSRFDWRVRLLTYLDLNAYVAWHFGNEGEFHFGLDVPPIPAEDLQGTPFEAVGDAFAQGARVIPPFIDVGVGASLRF